MSTKLTFDAATAALGRLYDGDPLATIAEATGMTERTLFADLSAFTVELHALVVAAQPTGRVINLGAHGGLHGLAEALPPGTRLVPRGEP